MKIANELPKDIVRNIGADIDEALAAISSKYNVKVRHSRIVQSETGFTTSLIGAARKTTKNIRQALLKLKLTPKAANYERAYIIQYGGLVKLANTTDLSSVA